MKRFFTIVATAILAASLSACTPNGTVTKQQVGTVAGGLAGGIIGASVFHGDSQAFAAVAGAVAGGLLGSAIGADMDRQDQVNANQAMASVPVGQEATWTNSKTRTQYKVRPIRTYYRRDGRRCKLVRVTTIKYASGAKKVIKTSYCH